jgi:hypothetical protein
MEVRSCGLNGILDNFHRGMMQRSKWNNKAANGRNSAKLKTDVFWPTPPQHPTAHFLNPRNASLAYSNFDAFSRSTATGQIAGTRIAQRKPHGRVRDEC